MGIRQVPFLATGIVDTNVWLHYSILYKEDRAGALFFILFYYFQSKAKQILSSRLLFHINDALQLESPHNTNFFHISRLLGACIKSMSPSEVKPAGGLCLKARIVSTGLAFFRLPIFPTVPHFSSGPSFSLKYEFWRIVFSCGFFTSVFSNVYNLLWCLLARFPW